MKRRFLALVLAGCLAAVLSTAAWATLPTLQNQLDNGGTVQLDRDIDISNTLVVTKDVTLDLNGHVLKMTGNGSVIHVKSGTLTLKDSNTEGKSHDFKVEDSGLWTLADDSYTSERKTVKGGVITGGTGSTYKYNNDIGQIVYNDCGGGMFVAPGASFVMKGGNIVGCSAGKSGGGVKVTNDGDFKMSGGTISGCTAGGGGGIDNRGTTTLSDNAKIKSCSATGTERDDHGGGVCSYRNLTVSGSMVISGCTAQNNNNSYAMYVTTGYPDARSSIEGGTFDGSVWLNHSNSGKITVSGGTFKNGVSGAWTVTFDTDGGTPEPESQIRANLPATKPDDPTKEGFDFGGWYTDAAFTTEYKFTESEKVTQDMPLYAKWTKEAAKYYYYSPADGRADTAKGSPKTFDPGVGIYAVSAALSLTGTAWIGRKRH